MIKKQLIDTIKSAIGNAVDKGDLRIDNLPEISVELSKNPHHGDWTTNAAMLIGSTINRPAREVADIIVKNMPHDDGLITKTNVAGQGFINISLKHDWLYNVLRAIISNDENYGKSDIGNGKKIIIEYVSTNPNGPITVAGGRNAAIGDAIASLLECIGYKVTREYYINDALNSVQMNNFGKSVFLKYLQLSGKDISAIVGDEEPDWLYHGDYITEIAKDIVNNHNDKFINDDIDNPDTIQSFRQMAQEGMIASQKADLEAFGARFDSWFSEAALYKSGAVDKAIEILKNNGYAYEKDGALWMKSTTFGDDKDRVLVRANGTTTYIAGDMAYHKDKLDRGFDLAIDVWGADHAGYIARTKAAIAELGYDMDRLEVILYQLVRIMKDGDFVKSSKRRGNVLELKSDLIDEIGKDAARFFYLTRSPNSELDIDIDLAKKKERENPVYYVQYAHARIVQALEKSDLADIDINNTQLDLLTQTAEIGLIKKLSEYPDEIIAATEGRAPQRITQYLRELAACFHAFYDAGNKDNDMRIANVNKDLAKARAVLVEATRIVLSNGLKLLGISAPKQM